MKVKIWSPEMHGDTEEDARDLEVSDGAPLRYAIERYAEGHFGDWDCPSEMDFCVRFPDGKLSKLKVEVMQEPVFTARYVK